MAARGFVVIILALVAVQSLAGDPSPVQDFCVADLNSESTVLNYITLIFNWLYV